MSSSEVAPPEEVTASEATTTLSPDRNSCEDCAKFVDAVAEYTCWGVAEIGCGLVCFEPGQYVDLASCEPQCSATIAAVCAASVPANEDPACSPFCYHEELTGDELVAVARQAALTADMRNVGPGETWSAGMQVGPVSESCTRANGGDACVTFVCHDPLAGCSSRWEGEDIVVDGGSTAIKAVRHQCTDGNVLLAISYLLSNNRLYHYYEWSQPKEDGIKTEAGRWRPDDQTPSVFRRTNSSHNGRPGKQKPTTTQRQATITAQQYEEDCPDGDSTECGCCSSDILDNRYFPTTDVQTLDTNEYASMETDISPGGIAGAFCKGLCGAYFKGAGAGLCGLVGCMGSQCLDAHESCAQCLNNDPPEG